MHGQRAVVGQLALDSEQGKLWASGLGSLLVGSIQRGVEIVRETAETEEKLANPDICINSMNLIYFYL